MHEYIFSILDINISERKLINRLVNRLRGDFIATETKDGAAYSVTFDSQNNADEFKIEANKIIPNLL